MSSYRGMGGAWDGGPPGAEAEYAGQRAPPAPPLPATDPWTGVSYSHYPQQAYDYQAYANYGYNYDSSYYSQHGGSSYYPDTRSASSAYPPAPAGYNYPPRPREDSRSPGDSRAYDRRRRSYSRSTSPRDRAYSRKRESSYEGRRKGRSHSRTTKSKRSKYSSSDQSRSRSRSYSRLRTSKKKRSKSSESSASDRSYKKSSKARECLTPPLRKKRSTSLSHRTPSPRRTPPRTPKIKVEKEDSVGKDTKHYYNTDIKIKREVTTPPPKKVKVSERSSMTPPKSYRRERSITPPKSYKSSSISKKKHRDNSLTPPRSYARARSSSSKSRSRSPSPRPKRKRISQSSSRSSSQSASPRRSRSKTRRRSRRKSMSRSRSHSQSRHRSHSKSRSQSRRRSKSKGKKKSVSPSKSRSKSRSRSQSGTPSEDERRGQFTVADRKRFWKVHRSRLEEKRSRKSPPKEVVLPPPGAIDNTKLDDIEYGVPPEIEGPNFDELLPTGKSDHEQALFNAASTSKAKNIPIPIKNDGSFLEMFKKLQEETKKIEEIEKKPEIKKPLPFIGKRRGGRVLKTGMVKKAKAIDEQTPDSTPKDAWSLYMQEVKKYRETSCEEERKTRPLVK